MALRQSNNKNTTIRHNQCKVNTTQNVVLTSIFNYVNVIVADKCHLRRNDVLFPHYFTEYSIKNIVYKACITSKIVSCRLKFEMLIFYTSQNGVNDAHK